MASEIQDSESGLIHLVKSFKKSQINLDIINVCSEQNQRIL